MQSEDDGSAAGNAERVAGLTRGADLAPVAEVLRTRRDEIIERWLTIARQQPFHRRRPDRAVTDHLPVLMGALVDLLDRTARPDAEPEAPLDDSRINDAASEHSFMRLEQGLAAADIVTEFRLLRHEISRVLRLYLDESESPADTVAAEMLVNDALDGATAMSLNALSDKVEQVRADFLAVRSLAIMQRLLEQRRQRAGSRPMPAPATRARR